MAMSINTNVQSLNAQRNLATSQSSLSTTMQRLSSGLRVNSAKDDAAGLAIAERMNAQVRGMNVAVRNANDGVSMAQTAEGALSKVTDALQRMRELAVQARNGTNGAKDQVSLNKEFVELGKEIDRVIKGADFNGKKILSTDAGAINFQVGANTSANDSITVTTSNLGTNTDIGNITSASIGSDATTALTATALATVISNLDTALDTVNSERAVLGATQNRFEAVVSNLQVASENTASARSRIMDADFASETANLSRSQILQQAGTAMVAQANQLPQGVLALLR
ncbi:flagellin [Delftia sp. HK171]|jgi:flagellin|uniref:flagellin domain-containing protein n=1 Tax=Delftia TaxID=80865 RepID=UPI000903B93C|nr:MULTISPECIES: flagellin domain-containing protein [Delftia]APE46379.1 flagellin [Delftia sp. HK171]ATH12334.1 flagellin FliC [Delftia acidovorans]MBO0989504.1 flagellin FliC [Delftia sp. SD083]MBO1036365.1 flagellin FliC [Delftia sp. SD018]MCA1071834.1 Flagellin [Delftia acidovorans]